MEPIASDSDSLESGTPFRTEEGGAYLDWTVHVPRTAEYADSFCQVDMPGDWEVKHWGSRGSFFVIGAQLSGSGQP